MEDNSPEIIANQVQVNRNMELAELKLRNAKIYTMYFDDVDVQDIAAHFDLAIGIIQKIILAENKKTIRLKNGGKKQKTNYFVVNIAKNYHDDIKKIAKKRSQTFLSRFTYIYRSFKQHHDFSKIPVKNDNITRKPIGVGEKEHKEIKEIARMEGRSIGGQVDFIYEWFINHHEEEEKNTPS